MYFHFEKAVANFSNIHISPRKIGIYMHRLLYSQNIRRYNAVCRDELVADVVENIGLKVDFQSIYFYIDYL